MKINAAQLLDKVITANASDLHVVAGSVPFLRINTALSPVPDEPVYSETDVEAFITQLVDAQQRQILEINKELDFSVALSGKARFRVNAFYQKGYLSAALRHIPLQIPSFSQLSLPVNLLNLCNLKQGLVLVVGPTGQGKSTTIASMLDNINETRTEHIITVEDPIEYVFTNKKSLVEQREMYLDTQSWDSALKSVLRQDPNVILLGEMRDAETMSTALQVAETGHLVFSTMHTNSSSQTIERFISSFSTDRQSEVRTQLAQVLEVVISQRLVITAKGTIVPALEVMLGTDAIKNLIREGKTHMIDNVINTSSQVGMVSLEKSLAGLVSTNVVDFDEAVKFTARPEDLKRFLGFRTGK